MAVLSRPDASLLQSLLASQVDPGLMSPRIWPSAARAHELQGALVFAFLGIESRLLLVPLESSLDALDNYRVESSEASRASFTP